MPPSGLENELQTLLGQFILLLLAASGLALVLASLLTLLAVRQLRHLDLSDNAGLLETLRSVPVTVVVALDLLDFGLDVFAAPFTWFLLRRLRLQALRNVAVVEALLPGTQVLPLMTLAWIMARVAPDAAIWPDVSRAAELRSQERLLPRADATEPGAQVTDASDAGASEPFRDR